MASSDPMAAGEVDAANQLLDLLDSDEEPAVDGHESDDSMGSDEMMQTADDYQPAETSPNEDPEFLEFMATGVLACFN